MSIPATSSLVDRTLAEARIRQETGLVVIAIRRVDKKGDEGPLIYNPGPEESVNAKDVLIVMGGPEQVDQLRRVVAH